MRVTEPLRKGVVLITAAIVNSSVYSEVIVGSAEYTIRALYFKIAAGGKK